MGSRGHSLVLRKSYAVGGTRLRNACNAADLKLAELDAGR